MLAFLTRDGKILLFAKAVRGVTYGFVSVLLATYLGLLGASETLSGVILGVALLSGAVLNIAASRWADRFGRRRFLALAGALMAASGVVLALTASLPGAVAAALLGALTPTAMEVGPFLSIEQAVLPQACDPARRPDAYAWYNLTGALAAAFGALFTGLAGFFALSFGGNLVAGIHIMFLLYAAAGGVSAVLALMLSEAVELNPEARAGPKAPLSPEGRRVVTRLTALFAVDSFAGGMIIRTFTALWFTVRFAPSVDTLGYVFFGANALSALSYLIAARLVPKLGLVRTMVYTHVPSNLFLVAMAFAPNFEIAIVLFLARMSVAQMDVAPRQQLVVTVVAERERTAAAGITNTARNISQAAGPFALGPVVAVAALGGIGAPFLLAGILKLVYDASLLRAFGKYKTEAPDS